MEWLPKCEELERAKFDLRVNGLIGEMNEACANRMAFVRKLWSVPSESVPTKTAMFFEEMMNKEGSREWLLADLVREGKEREPQFIYYERAKIDDLRLARQINALCDTLKNVINERWSFVGELDMLAYKFMPGKMVEFMKETQDKDISNLMKLQILGREFELRAREKDLSFRSSSVT
ncbi:hypothetical protein Tco_0587604 [Tanacetum coccineum]